MSATRILLDTNVVLDFVLKREGFVEKAQIIFLWHEQSKIEIHISTLTLANTAYIVKKNDKDPFAVTSVLVKWLKIIPLQLIHFEKNLASNFKDFEDGLQYFSALVAGNIEAIVTRNSKDFSASVISVQSPDEFIKSMEQ